MSDHTETHTKMRMSLLAVARAALHTTLAIWPGLTTDSTAIELRQALAVLDKLDERLRAENARASERRLQKAKAQ